MMFSAMAYVLMDALRRIALRHTVLANSAINTIQLKLLKIGTLVRISDRRIRFAKALRTPNRMEFEIAHIYLRRAFSSG